MIYEWTKPPGKLMKPGITFPAKQLASVDGGAFALTCVKTKFLEESYVTGCFMATNLEYAAGEVNFPTLEDWKNTELQKMHDEFVTGAQHLHVIYRTLPESCPINRYNFGIPERGIFNNFVAAFLITEQPQLFKAKIY